MTYTEITLNRFFKQLLKTVWSHNSFLDFVFIRGTKVTPDDDLKTMLKKIYEQESSMIFTSIIGETVGDLSYDDQIFLRLMDREIVQVDNHYEAHLPLKSTDITLPNNKSARKRLNCLKRRIIRD